MYIYICIYIHIYIYVYTYIYASLLRAMHMHQFAAPDDQYLHHLGQVDGERWGVRAHLGERKRKGLESTPTTCGGAHPLLIR
jgi:hypothetical protein